MSNSTNAALEHKNRGQNIPASFGIRSANTAGKKNQRTKNAALKATSFRGHSIICRLIRYIRHFAVGYQPKNTTYIQPEAGASSIDKTDDAA